MWAERLDPLVRFLNSGLDPAMDPFRTAATCRFWLGDRGHPTPRAGPASRALLLDLRAVLRHAVSDRPGGTAVRQLADVASRAGMTLRFDAAPDGRPRWALAASPGAPRYAAHLLAAVMRAMDDDTWSRLRVCPGQGCGVAFVDTTRAGRRTWCSMARCGNRAKQARWRTTHARSLPAPIQSPIGASS